MLHGIPLLYLDTVVLWTVFFQHLDDMDGFPRKKTTFLAYGDLMRGRLPQSTQGADGLGRSCEFLEVS
jgi:hypothetical protein